MLEKSPNRIRRMFDAIAPWYDFLNRFFSLGIDRRWRRKTADRLIDAETVAGPILDICCGTGDLSIALWKKCQAHAKNNEPGAVPLVHAIPREIYGIDFSPEMLEIAKKKRKKLRIEEKEIHFSIGDALSIPFESERFSVVTVAFGLRNVGETDRCLSEMVRVCRPGGRVAVLEFSMPTLPILGGLYRFYFRSVLPRIGRWLTKNPDDAYSYLPESVLAFDDPASLRGRMERLGLIDVQTTPMTFGIATLLVGRRPH